jgi:hypothetical protein
MMCRPSVGICLRMCPNLEKTGHQQFTILDNAVTRTRLNVASDRPPFAVYFPIH